MEAAINLSELTDNITNQFKPQAAGKGILLNTLMSNDIPDALIADPVQLKQILHNLVSNAIKFTDKGAVTIGLQLKTLTKDRVTIYFSVKDTGRGIPEATHETIFKNSKPQQHASDCKHTGTGLWLTQRLAELHNSKIFLKSTPGEGTEFYFEMSFLLANDRHSAPTAARNNMLSQPRKKLTGLRILFAEDNHINVLVAKKQLEHFGVIPDCAYNGREALTMLENNSYHVALLDLHMPFIDGYALAEVVHRQYPDTHVIIFTADVMTEVRTRLAQFHVYDILNKPVSLEKMYEVLLNVTRSRNIVD